MRFLIFIFLLFFLNTPAIAACTNPDGVPGELMYNQDSNVFQGCTKRGWMAFHPIVPPDCPDIGDMCKDGTIFAGLHQVTNERFYIPTTDQQKPGSPGTFTMLWKYLPQANDISVDSSDDGRINHANKVGSLVSFQAFNACESLNFGGHTDWYLPSRNELYRLYTNKAAIVAKGHTTFVNDLYWASTEFSAAGAYIRDFSNGASNTYSKGYSNNRVRCIRR